MKPLRIAGIVIGILVLLAAGAIAWLASQFDPARIKSELTRAVQEEKQRTLRINGELELAFWPSIGVRLGKLSLSERASPQEFAAVDTARVSVAVLPLLGGRIVADAVEVAGLRATVVKHKDGSLNIDDLLSSDKSEQPVRLEVAAVKVSGAALTWRDEQKGSTSTVSGLDLTTGKLRIDTAAKAYAAEGVKLSALGKLGADDFEVRVEAPRLALTPEASGGENVALTAKLAGAQRRVEAKLDLRGVEGKGGMLTVAKLAFSVDARSGETALKAALESPLVAQVDAAKRGIVLDKLAGSVELSHPRLPVKPLKLPIDGRLAADLDKQSAEAALNTRFDESKLALRVDVRKFAPLALAFDLDIDRLNVDRYLPPRKPGAEPAKGDDRLDFSALEGLDVDGTVRIGSLQVANVKASNVRLKIKAAGARLEVAPHSAALYGGTLNGSLMLNAKGNSVALKQDLTGIAINPLMKDLADKDLIEGRGNVALDVTTRGDSMTAMKKALAGTASVSLRDGAIKGIDLARALRELKAKLSSKEDAVQQAQQTQKTDFSELSASFRIANGVARNDDLAAKSPFLRLSGSGDIDIGNGRLDYLAKASVVSTSGGQGGKELEHLKGLTIPVRASGPFDKLAYRLEFGSLASEAVKAKVEEKTEAIKQQAKEKLLKGLFGK